MTVTTNSASHLSAGDQPVGGPWVSVAVPRRAYVSWLLHSGGELVEVYIGGERTGGVYITLRVGDLDRVIRQLAAVSGTVCGSFQPSRTCRQPSPRPSQDQETGPDL
jgi:hypothetical protein